MEALGLPEELLLLTLDDETGRPVGRQGMAPGLALAGAVVMELALAGRIDTDGDRLQVVEARPTGDAVLDGALAHLAGGDATAPDSRAAILLLARHEAEMREALLARLVARELLRAVDGRVLFVLPERRYPKPEARAEPVAVRERLRGVVLDEDSIPEPRDTLLLGLARAAGLLPLLLSPEELAGAQERLALLTRLEALNGSLIAAIAEIGVHRLR